MKDDLCAGSGLIKQLIPPAVIGFEETDLYECRTITFKTREIVCPICASKIIEFTNGPKGNLEYLVAFVEHEEFEKAQAVTEAFKLWIEGKLDKLVRG